MGITRQEAKARVQTIFNYEVSQKDKIYHIGCIIDQIEPEEEKQEACEHVDSGMRCLCAHSDGRQCMKCEKCGEWIRPEEKQPEPDPVREAARQTALLLAIKHNDCPTLTFQLNAFARAIQAETKAETLRAVRDSLKSVEWFSMNPAAVNLDAAIAKLEGGEK